MSDEWVKERFDSLLYGADKSAADYLAKAHRSIDDRFGAGFAAKNPALVAAFMRVAASDFNTALSLKILESSFQQLATSIADLAKNLRQPS
jgi:hypothetical protein